MNQTSHILVIGVGGLSHPALLALWADGFRRFTLFDDDVVERSNLHRQVLFELDDVGRYKADVVAEKLQRRGADAEISVRRERFRPGVKFDERVDLVLEGADNYPTKYFVSAWSQERHLATVHGGAIKWGGWALLCPPGGACLSCVFGSKPDTPAQACNELGVVGPAVGLIGAVQGRLGSFYLAHDVNEARLMNIDGKSGRMHPMMPTRSADCTCQKVQSK